MASLFSDDVRTTPAVGSFTDRTTTPAGNDDCVPSSNGVKSALEETKKADHTIIALVVALTAIIFTIDAMTPLGTATWALYALPLGLSRWSPMRPLTLIMAGACTVLIIVAHFLSAPGPSSGVDVFNRVFGVLMVWIGAFFLNEEVYGSRRLGGVQFGRMRLRRWDWPILRSYLATVAPRDPDLWRRRGEELTQQCVSILCTGAQFGRQELLVRMPSDSVDGVLHSARGLRFEWKTKEFLRWTSECEERKPGAREEIIAEAHHLAVWPHHVAEIAFFIGTLYANLFFQNRLISIVLGFVCLIAAFHLEVIRFYSQGPTGTSRALSYLSMTWGLLKWPAFLIAAVMLWPHGKIISIAFVLFLIVQGRLKRITEALSPLRMAATSWIVNRMYGQAKTITYVTEAMSMAWVIDRWRQEQGLPPRST